MSYYNNKYSYPDLYLWDERTWEGVENQVAPIFHKIGELIKEDLKERPPIDCYSDRHDEVSDNLNRSKYFPDVVEAWKEKGMYYQSYGMMGDTVAPEAIDKHEVYDAKVLYIPYVRRFDDDHQTMNLLEQYKDVLIQASKENIIVQFCDCGESVSGALMEKGIETQGTYRISYSPVYLDITILSEHGVSLKDIEGLELEKWSEPETLAGLSVVDISDKWQLNIAHQYSISQIYKRNQPGWDFDRHIRSLAGKRQAEGMRLEHDYTGPDDPKMNEFWEERGICLENHYIGNDWYVTLTPKTALEDRGNKIPMLIVMKEPRTACPVTMQTAFQFYYDFIEICARGEYMMLYFALETPWDNDEVLPLVIEEVANNYPVDTSRIYLTGQSHNGYYALEFYRNHPELIAAVATLSDPVGLQTGARIADFYRDKADEIIDSFRKHDFPLIDINGNLENSYAKKDRSKEKIDDDVFFFQNRMKAFRLHEWTRDEILAAQESSDKATRLNGVPSDRSEVRYLMGSEAYISDFCNDNGKWYFRYISLENTPHMIMPQMADLSWEFLRRFARDIKTGETIELF